MLENYTTLEKLNDTLSAYTTAADLETMLENYTTESELESALEDYAKIEKLNDTLSAYTTAEDMNALLEELAIKDSTALADTAAALRAAMPEAQVQSDWAEENEDSKAFIQNKPGVSMVNFWYGSVEPIIDNPEDPENLLESFGFYNPDPEMDDQVIDIVIPKQEITFSHQDILDTAKHFIEATTGDEVYQLLSSLQQSEAWPVLKDTIINYIKAHKAEAVEIVESFISQMDANDVNGAFDALESMPTATKAAIINALGDFIERHSATLTEIYNYFAPQSIIPQMIHDSLANIQMPEVNNPKLIIYYPNNVLYENEVEEEFQEFYANGTEDVEVTLPVVNPLTLRFITSDGEIEYNASSPATEEQMSNDGVIEIEMPKSTFTHEELVDTVKNFITATTDAELFDMMYALQQSNVWPTLKDTIINYIKAHKNVAMGIALDYLKKLTADDVEAAFDALEQMPTATKAAMVDALGNFIENHSTTLTPIFEYFVAQSTAIPEMIQNAISELDIPEPANDATITLFKGTEAADNAIGSFSVNATEPVNIVIPEDGITTEAIVAYLSANNCTAADVDAIYNALSANQAAKEELVTKAKNYIMNHKDYAIEVLNHYMQTATADDVNGLFNQLSGNTEVKQAIINKAKSVIINHEDDAIDVLKAYAANMTEAQADTLIKMVENLPAPVKQAIIAKAKSVIINHEADAIDVLAAYAQNMTDAQAQQLIAMVQSLPADVKQRIKDYIMAFASSNRAMINNLMMGYLNGMTAEEFETILGTVMSRVASNDQMRADVVDVIELVLSYPSVKNAFKNALLPTETSQMYTATEGQTTFTLNNTPNSNYLVRLYINGVMVGDSATGVVTVDGTTVTYVPAQNGGEPMEVGDKIIISYFK